MPTLDWPSSFSVHGVATRLNRHLRSTSSKSVVSYLFAQSRIAVMSFTIGLRFWAWPAEVAAPNRNGSRQMKITRRRAADLAIVVVPLCSWPFLSAFWRRHLTPDLATRVGLGVNIDIPLTRHHLLRLFGRQRG